MTGTPHISVCVCTYRRPGYLRRLIGDIERQQTHGRFTHDITIVDNDREASAWGAVEEAEPESAIPISYDVEPEQNIALARNKAVANAKGDLLAFIDDDEIPGPEWLARLHDALVRFGADGVLGPVNPRFDTPPPAWARAGAVFERPGCPTGVMLEWRNTRTGNVLIKRSALDAVEGPFRAEFGRGGEDRDFFRRAIETGCVFVGCEEAAVDEIVPAERMRISFQLRRALLRGRMAVTHLERYGIDMAGAGWGRSVLKSFVACAGYTLALPLMLLAGRHVFVKYLIKDADHLGKLIALFHLDVVRQKYVVK